VGIIANPSAGKDIRRLVAHGRLVPNHEKVNIIRRVLLALDVVGVSRVVIMPDTSALGSQALQEAPLSMTADMLNMPVFGNENDSANAAELMVQMGAGCLVTLGGDGTNRVVSKGSGQVPLVPISTGTNNVFPAMVEGTTAGLAAGLVAMGQLDLAKVSITSKRLEVYIDGALRDIALIDLAISKERAVAARAIWNLSTIHEIFLCRAEPSNIGLSAIGAWLRPVSEDDRSGIYIRLGPGGTTVLAAVAPGMVQPVPIANWRVLSIGERVEVVRKPSTIALDGERQFTVQQDQKVEVVVSDRGPRTVAIDTALMEAARLGLFVYSRR
jgi:predicted polyphosphate/ATP-dependent NAD kinase